MWFRPLAKARTKKLKLETKPQVQAAHLQEFLLDREPTPPEPVHEDDCTRHSLTEGRVKTPVLGDQVRTRDHLLKYRFVGPQRMYNRSWLQ